MKTRSTLPLLLLVISFNASAYETEHLRIQIPNNWSCSKSTIHHVCKPQTSKPNPMVLILSGSKAPQTENLANVSQLISSPKTLPNSSGSPTQSKVYYSKPININNIKWFNSLHYASELPNYFTRYLATYKNGYTHIASLSVHKDYFSKNNTELNSILQSITLKPKLVANTQSSNPLSEIPIAVRNKENMSTLVNRYTPYLAGILAIGIALFALVRIKRK